MTIDFGLGLTAGPWKGAIEAWHRDLDEILPPLEGHFRSLWMCDHFFWEDDPTYEAMTAIIYLAGRFPKWEVGPMVLGQSYRNPAMLAQMATTLQTISEGRFIMGIGAGWKEDEYRAYGYPYPAASVRIEQLEDTIEIMKRMWTEPGQFSYTGKHYRVENVWSEPKPDPIPPIMVGGAGSKTLMVTAKHADWWNLSDANYDRFKERLGVLLGHCDTIGRDPASIRKTWFGRVSLGKTEAEALELGRKAAPRRAEKAYTMANAFVGTPAQVVDEMGRFVQDFGVDYFMIDVLGLPSEEITGMVVEEVVAKLR